MQSLRSTSVRRLCLSLTTSVTRTSRNPPLSVLFGHTRSFASVSPQWGSGVRQFSYRANEDGKEEESGDPEAANSTPTNTEEGTNTLYIGNIPFEATESDLHKIFSPYGSMSKIAVGNQNGKPLGYAHVEFATKSSAVKVFKDNEDRPVVIGGRPVRIDFAWPRKPKVPQRERDAEREPKPPSPTLFLGNLPPETTQEDIIEVLGPIGIILDVRIGRKGDTFKGFAHVDFENTEEAEKVLEHHQRDPIHVFNWKAVLDRSSPPGMGHPPSHKLYFSKWEGDESSLRSHFRALSSNIVDISFLPRRDSPALAGFVIFRDIANAKEALARFNGPELELAYPRPERPFTPKPTTRWQGGNRGGNRGGSGFGRERRRRWEGRDE